MNLKQKVENVIEQLVYCDLRTTVGIDKARDIIRLALKNQDKDTRHACAEMTPRSAHIHNLIMNCREGLE